MTRRLGSATWDLLPWLTLALVLLAGCNHRPRAPALQDEPVYLNAQEGFRFLVPTGWKQSARSILPPGPVQKERMLVEYKPPPAETAASLQVTCIDLPSGTSPESYLSTRRHGTEPWRQKGAVEPLDVNGESAVRLILTSRTGKEQLTREVVVFRRGDRAYFFTGLFPASDGKTREQVRQAVESVQWKG